MTTLAALLGAVPLAFAIGPGSEIRRPLGITIIGGLVVSQVLTLYTTPVYLLEKLKARWTRGSAKESSPSACRLRPSSPPPRVRLPPPPAPICRIFGNWEKFLLTQELASTRCKPAK